MRRPLDFLLRNWPLKLGAAALATVLYGGVVLSESTRVWPGQVPIEIRNAPADTALLTVLEPLNSIEYRAPIDVASRLTNGSFQAFVDLAGVQPEVGGSTVPVAVQLLPVDGRVQIVDFGPKTVNIALDPVQSREMPVSIDIGGEIPQGLDVDPAQVSPANVSLRGASTRLMNVRTATGRVTIDGSAINIDQELEVLPLDETGNPVPGVVVEPPRVRVRIAVAREQRTATLPVVPSLVGQVDPGYVLRSVALDPLSVTVSGEEPEVARLTAINTAPLDLTGRTGTVSVTVPLAPPPEITINGSDSVMVTLEIGQTDVARTLESGVQPEGVQPGLSYALSSPSVLVTLAGPIAELDSVDAATLFGYVDVTGLNPGAHELDVMVTPPASMRLVALVPDTVTVVITAAPASAAPASAPPASAAPSGSVPPPGSAAPSGSVPPPSPPPSP